MLLHLTGTILRYSIFKLCLCVIWEAKKTKFYLIWSAQPFIQLTLKLKWLTDPFMENDIGWNREAWTICQGPPVSSVCLIGSFDVSCFTWKFCVLLSMPCHVSLMCVWLFPHTNVSHLCPVVYMMLGYLTHMFPSSCATLSCLVFLASGLASILCKTPRVQSVFHVPIIDFALSLSVPSHN